MAPFSTTADASAPSGVLATVLDDFRTVTAASPRPLGAVLCVAGIVHVLAPGTLLALADHGYDRVLGVDFQPGETTTRRVRAIGVGLLLAGAHLLYYGGLTPE